MPERPFARVSSAQITGLRSLAMDGRMIEHRRPTAATQKHVLAASGNQCAFPACSRLIFDLEHETLIGTVAHIRARKEGGPRFDPSQTEDENRSFANLLAMCAEHSKIIDGPRAGDLSVSTLQAWKAEHERKVTDDADRSWIRPANTIVRMTPDGQALRIAYWVDQSGRPRLFRREQLAVVNVLQSLNLMFLQLGSLPERLHDAATSGVELATALQQGWTKFKVERSVIADFSMLMAMAGNITFAEFLGFMIKGNDPTRLVAEGARRVQKMADGEPDPIASRWHQSDPEYFE